MAITYNADANRIRVTGGTVNEPILFTDIYNADKAGTLVLIDRDGINSVDGDPVNNAYNLRPADEKVMGGAKHDLYIVVENWNAISATVQLIGTNENDESLTEDIKITGNGTYYVSELFKILTHTQVTAFSGRSFDYSLVQGQWGVVWKQGGRQFLIEAKLYIGDGNVETWLVSEEETVVNLAPIYHTFRISNKAHFRAGRLENEVATKGSVFLFPVNWGGYNKHVFRVESGGYLELYSSRIMGLRPTSDCYCPSISWERFSHIKLRHVHIEHINQLRIRTTDIDSDWLTIERCASGITIMAAIPPMSHTIIKLQSSDNVSAGGLGVSSYATHLEFEFRDVILEQNVYDVSAGMHNIFHFINPTWEESLQWYGDEGELRVEWTFNLKVVDKNGNPIQGTKAVLWDINGNKVFEKVADSNGIIAEKIVEEKRYVNPDTTPTYYTPHTIEITKGGYQAYKEKFTLNKKIDWTIALEHSNVCVDQEVILP